MAQSDNVEFKHSDYLDNMPDWDLVRLLTSGQRRFKKVAFNKGYLPKLNPSDESSYNINLNKSYLQRAVLYPFVSHTLGGLVGLAFGKQPVITLNKALEYLKFDANGSGVELTQSLRYSIAEVLKSGRIGLLVDMPPVEETNALFKPEPRILQYNAETIINWRKDLVVLEESYTEYGVFSEESKPQWRVLRIVEGVYIQQVWRKDTKGVYYIHNEFTPTMDNGANFDYIPFFYAGSENNSASCDKSPLLDLCDISVAHFRNSADEEHAGFWAGQPQPYMSGLDQNWLDTVINPVNEDGTPAEGAFELGSSSVLPLPEGGVFDYAQANPNVIPSALGENKVDLITKLGAKLIEKGGANTKIEANQNSQSENSILGLIVENVENAYNAALDACSEFTGSGEDSNIEFNREFVQRELTAQEITALVNSWNQGALPQSDLVAAFQKYGLIDPDKDLEEVKDELETDMGGLGLGNDNAE